MLFLYKINPKNRVIQFATYFSVLFFIAFFLFILRNKIPDFLSIVLANTSFAVGTISLYIAIKASLKLDSKWHVRDWIPILVIFVGFFIFTYASFSFNTRIVIYCLFATVYFSLMGWLFWVYGLKQFKLFDFMSILLFIYGAIAFLSVMIYANIEAISTYYFSNTSFIMYLPNIFYLLLNFWTVALVKYRIKNESYTPH